VGSVQLVTKEQAWAEQKQKFNHIPELNSLENPLGDELHVTVSRPTAMRGLAHRIQSLGGVDEVRQGQRAEVDRLMQVGKVVNLIGSAISAMLLLATALIIGNAIRLGVFSRRKEIRIMQLVGATDGFVRTPFLLEGMFHGALGGLIACAALDALSHALTDFLSRALPFLPFSFAGLPVGTVYAVLIGSGVLIGLAGSYLSVRRFLLQGRFSA
jgi:cell division transport system permease protein